VAKVEYLGPISETAFVYLARKVLLATKPAKVLDIHMQRCLMLAQRAAVPVGEYQHNATPGCVIVRPDQYEAWSAYAHDLALIGVKRVVFLESQRPLAKLWLERQQQRHDLPRL
jgi:hypothetical protein